MELRRVAKPGAQVVVAMPCDPGLLNRLVKRVVTYRSMRAAGVVNPRLAYAREHINGIGNLLELAKHVYDGDSWRIHWFPTSLKSWNLNLVCILDVQVGET